MAPSKDAGVAEPWWQKIPQPQHIVASGPCLLAVAVRTMNGDDAGKSDQNF
ncbi:MAG: hypothetical protein LQ347_003885 [Umbilicaria vellea]|nr:MAG: hypothetical protein LQ347_003885 [Umbilicaria vellea]